MPSFSKITNSLAALAALLATATAHTSVEKINIGGVDYDGFRAGSKAEGASYKGPAWLTNQGWGFQPIYGDALDKPEFICHKDASPSTFVAEAAAGSDVTFTWSHTGSPEAGNEVGWDASHHGWTATYLAPVSGDVASIQPGALKFTKIHSAGLIDYRQGRYSQGQAQAQTGYWGTDAIFYDNNNKQTVKIPANIPSGTYVLRTEVMSIHNNGDVKNRQFWPQCMTIKVTGGADAAMGATTVSEGKPATQLYTADDALLKLDLYWHEPNVKGNAPGPAIPQAIAAALSGNTSTPPATTPAAPVVAAPVVPAPVSSPAPSPAPEPSTEEPDTDSDEPEAEVPRHRHHWNRNHARAFRK